MIICFSGAGNSRSVADKIQEFTGDEIVRLAPGFMKNPQKAVIDVDDDRLIWIFPVHAWSLPALVLEVIEKTKFNMQPDTIHHMVATCGDDIGLTESIWRKAIQAKGWKACAAYSIQMPNIYTFLPGFNVDSKAVATAKIEAMVEKVEKISVNLASADPIPEIDVVRGSYPWIKSRIFNPFFLKVLKRTHRFHTTADCNGCGTCMRNCPFMTISMSNGRPKWTDPNCIMCTRCYQVCPNHAIRYGRWSNKKGQYLCPGFATNK